MNLVPIGLLLALSQSLAITVLNETSVKEANSPTIYIPKSIDLAIPHHSNELKFLRTINLAPLIEETNEFSNSTSIMKFKSSTQTLPIILSENLKGTTFDEGFFSTRTKEKTKSTLAQTSTQTSNSTNFRLFEIGGYCNILADGLYDDPEDCENFIICYASRTFRTKCALGTKWNHIRKQCDYPHEVDCDRRPSTIPTTMTSTTKNLVKKRTSAYPQPRKTVQSNVHVEFTEKNEPKSSKYRSNIVLLSILLPLAIIATVILAISMYVWKKTYKNQTRRHFQINRQESQSQINLSTVNIDDQQQGLATISNNKWTCSWNPIYWNRRRSSAFKPVEHYCSQSGQCMKSLKSNSGRITNTNEDTQNKTNIHTINTNDFDCGSLSQSRATMESNFMNDENRDWEYSYATRGLYLSQPWVRGYYNRALASVEFLRKSDCIGDSVVLTLDPCDLDKSNDNDRNHQTKQDQNDLCQNNSDGYYA